MTLLKLAAAQLILLIIALTLSYYKFKFAIPFTFGIIVSQQVLLGIYTACFDLPLMLKLRWLFRILIAQWLILMIPSTMSTGEWPVPLSTLGMQVIILAGALMGAGLYNLFSQRKIASERNQPPTFNLNLVDLFVLTTATAVVVSICLKFQDPVPKGMLAGIGYVIVFWASLVIGAPLAFCLSLLSVGILATNNLVAKCWIYGWGILITTASIAAFFSSPKQEEAAGWFGFIAGTGLLLFLSIIVLRKAGLRLTKINRDNKVIAHAERI